MEAKHSGSVSILFLFSGLFSGLFSRVCSFFLAWSSLLYSTVLLSRYLYPVQLSLQLCSTVFFSSFCLEN